MGCSEHCYACVPNRHRQLGFLDTVKEYAPSWETVKNYGKNILCRNCVHVLNDYEQWCDTKEGWKATACRVTQEEALNQCNERCRKPETSSRRMSERRLLDELLLRKLEELEMETEPRRLGWSECCEDCIQLCKMGQRCTKRGGMVSGRSCACGKCHSVCHPSWGYYSGITGCDLFNFGGCFRKPPVT